MLERWRPLPAAKHLAALFVETTSSISVDPKPSEEESASSTHRDPRQDMHFLNAKVVNTPMARYSTKGIVSAFTLIFSSNRDLAFDVTLVGIRRLIVFSRKNSFGRWTAVIVLAWIACLAPRFTWAQAATPVPPSEQRLIELGTGDSITIQVYGQPDMTITVYVSDDGTIPVPLVGAVKVAGLSPSEAATQVEQALKKGGFLVDPHVTLTVLQTRSQRISVLGEVRTPGRFSVESNTTIFDLLALAGGATELGSDTAYVLRPTPSGVVERIPLDIQNLSANENYLSDFKLKTGDSVFVPKAEKFYILGAVRTPNGYKLHPGTTILQAIAIGGGLTETGSDSRIEIKRKQKDGKIVTMRGRLGDEVLPDDVIRIKESIF